MLLWGQEYGERENSHVRTLGRAQDSMDASAFCTRSFVVPVAFLAWHSSWNLSSFPPELLISPGPLEVVGRHLPRKRHQNVLFKLNQDLISARRCREYWYGVYYMEGRRDCRASQSFARKGTMD